MFWMESPVLKYFETLEGQIKFSQGLFVLEAEGARVKCKTSFHTVVFSRSSGVGFDSLEDEAGVANDLPDELHEDGGQEPEHPVADVVCAPDEVQEEAEDEDDEGVGVKHVLGAPGPVPLLDKQRPPGSLVPSHR